MAYTASHHIIDDAREHFQSGSFRLGSPLEQAYLHIGVFLGWVIERKLYSKYFEEEGETAIFRFKNRSISCIILGELWEGILSYEQLNKECRAFAADYYASGQYFSDYEQELGRDYNNMYAVEDTEFNYQRMYRILEKRFKSWRRKKKPSTRS